MAMSACPSEAHVIRREWNVCRFAFEDFAMAETTKLSVGQVLDKLRGTDVPKSQITRLDEKLDALDQETQHLKAPRRRLERDQRAAATKRA
jgi:hypothetical protein